MIRVFDFVAAGRVGIIASGAGMFAKKIEKSCTAPAVSKDEEKNPRSS